jgi:hypothetical protein
MASNLTVDTLTKGATTLNTDELVDVNNKRVCKAWAHFNGTGVVSIGDSFNVSSVVDTGVGRYTVNWLTDFASVNYSVAGHVYDSSGNAVFFGSNIANIQTVGAFSFTSYAYNAAIYDTERNSIIAFGDQ